MNLDRRSFLQRAALGTAGLVAGANAHGADKASTAAKTGTISLPVFDAARPEAFWSAVRDLYPLARDLTYFNTGGLGPASTPALAMAEETTRKLQSRSEHGHAQFDGARATVARFLGVEPEEIALVRNATEGNAIVAAGLKLASGDEVIFESHAHPGGSYPWYNQLRLRGVVVKLFEPSAGDPAENLARIVKLITPRTRVVQVSHVTAPTGIVMPVHAIAAACRERKIWFHVDGAQSAGMFPVNLRALGCDSFATSGHKWIGGPLETGVLFVQRARQDEVEPVLVGAYSGELEFLPGELKLTPTAVRYEYGTRNVASALGLATAIELQEKIGRERIAARGRFLAERVRAGLAQVPTVEILTPSVASAAGAMITFRSTKLSHDRLFGELMKGYAMRCRPVSEQKLNALRVSLHVFNSPAECDALIAATDKILRQA